MFCPSLLFFLCAAQMTHVAFNPEHPIIVVGDDRGVIRTFKLGPNLHKVSAKLLL